MIKLWIVKQQYITFQAQETHYILDSKKIIISRTESMNSNQKLISWVNIAYYKSQINYNKNVKNIIRVICVYEEKESKNCIGLIILLNLNILKLYS